MDNHIILYAILALMPQTPENQQHPEQRDLIPNVRAEIEKLTETGLLNPRVIPALTLYAYNFLQSHPGEISEEERNLFLHQCREVNNWEEEYSRDQRFTCTVGSEIEWYYRPEIRYTLSQLGISNVPAYDDEPSNPLWEVNLPWTYSSKTQAFMVRQLREMGAFITAQDFSLPRETPNPLLHLNFGIPSTIGQDIVSDGDVQERIMDINDAIVASYTSPTRLANRKTTTTFTSDKETDQSLMASIAGDVSKPQYRWEFRALEIIEATFGQQAEDMQNLVTALLLWIKYEKILLFSTPLETSIIESFDEFVREMDVLRNRKRNGLPYNFARADNEKNLHHTIAIVNNQKLVETIRGIVQKTSSAIGDFLHPTEDEL